MYVKISNYHLEFFAIYTVYHQLEDDEEKIPAR